MNCENCTLVIIAAACLYNMVGFVLFLFLLLSEKR